MHANLMNSLGDLSFVIALLKKAATPTVEPAPSFLSTNNLDLIACSGPAPKFDSGESFTLEDLEFALYKLIMILYFSNGPCNYGHIRNCISNEVLLQVNTSQAKFLSSTACSSPRFYFIVVLLHLSLSSIRIYSWVSTWSRLPKTSQREVREIRLLLRVIDNVKMSSTDHGNAIDSSGVNDNLTAADNPEANFTSIGTCIALWV